MSVRFDDMAATVIASAGAAPASRAAAWRQLVDLAAQARGEARDLYDALESWRGDVALDVRRQAARSLVGMRIPPALFTYFASDALTVAAPLAGTARFTDAEWTALLPGLPTPVRGLLRNRRDLPQAVVQALAAFGPADFVIEGPPASLTPVPAPDPETGGVEIRALVDRIEAYRRDHPLPVAARPAPAERAETFRFETGADGVVVWVEGAPRQPLIGLTLALAADSHDHGVDGHVAGAYRRRAPFRDGRLSVAGAGPASGEWRVSGVAVFTQREGRFTGYRGTARRPRSDEVAQGSGLYGSTLAPDSLRQLVHELRTPLNAILGFAEMIDSEVLGPAARDYRDRAVEITGEARRLIAAVEDLDTAARTEGETPRLEGGAVDGAALLQDVCASLTQLTDDRGVHLRVGVARALPPVAVEPRALERMVARLLAATVAVSARGETIAVRLEGVGGGGGGAVALSAARPRALTGQDERALLDPGYTPEGDWPEAPLLGLGFALRLVRNLAVAAGGAFLIEREAFVLRLPAALEGADGRRGEV